MSVLPQKSWLTVSLEPLNDTLARQAREAMLKHLAYPPKIEEPLRKTEVRKDLLELGGKAPISIPQSLQLLKWFAVK